MSGALRPATRALLHARLDALDAGAALPFAEAVTAQVAHPLGAHDPDDPGDAHHAASRERAVAAALLGAVEAAVGPRHAHVARDAAAALAADAALLSACYTNLDLLPRGGAADAIALLVGHAVELLAGRPTP